MSVFHLSEDLSGFAGTPRAQIFPNGQLCSLSEIFLRTDFAKRQECRFPRRNLLSRAFGVPVTRRKIPAFFRKDHRIGNSPDARGGYEAAQETESNERLCEAIAEYCTVSNRNYVQSHFVFPEDYGSSGKGDVRVVELFAGVGGFRVGLERASARFKTIWANQWEPSTKRQDAFVCYADKFGAEAHCSNDDINSVPAANVPECDLLVGGFPCQDYSVAATLKRSGGIQGKKGVLWWEIHRIVNEATTKPKFLFLENVDRLLKSPAKQRGRDFAIILASLADLGYAVEWRVINAADYGMPQRRRRTYILAYHSGTKIFGSIQKSGDAFSWLKEKGVISDAFPCAFEKKSEFEINGTLEEITRNFNKSGKPHLFRSAGLMIGRKVVTTDSEATYAGPRLTLGQLLVPEEDVPAEFFIPAEELEKWRYLKGGKSEKRVSRETGFEYNYSEGSMAFPDYLDRPSRTVITGEGGSGPSRFKHVVLTPSGRYRRLVPVELERLNMFPDNHTEKASDSRRAFLMGNALVTGVVEKIGRSLLARV